ncbi:NERD domain-containing protein [Nocardioides sp. zg-DK7169]|nr:nuclease-related domain-containing protein [Nocardioides sp. zg-DK7169]NPC96736.1 NERD domain-containing protein [Nocardioides sp. zg-DK7169]
MRLRYAGVCRCCGTDLPPGEHAVYEQSTKAVRCVACPPSASTGTTTDLTAVPPPAPAEGGAAGASARREYERRKAKDEERLRQKWGRFGGIAVALADEKQSTKAWATGAEGEERLGARLDSLASESVGVLHDRRIPRSRANIDHIAVTTAGVWVIDAKRYQGRPELRIEGGIFRRRVEKLFVGRRDCTALVDGVLAQVGLVEEVVGDVPVTGALCFVDADWPLIGGAFTTRGVHALWPKRLAKLLAGAEGSVDVPAVRQALAAHFPPA